MDDNKSYALFNRIYGISGEGNFYRARTSITSTLTEEDDLGARAIILFYACIKNESAKERESWAGLDRAIMFNNYIRYQNF
jgi:hypothetical protein